MRTTTTLLFTALALGTQVLSLPTDGGVVAVPSSVTSLDLIEPEAPEWNGDVGLEKRVVAPVVYAGVTAAFLSVAAVSGCSSAIASLSIVPCVATFVAGAIGALFGAMYTTGILKRDLDDFDFSHGGAYAWKYLDSAAAFPEHTNMLQHWGHVHDNEVADGLPIFVGNSVCNSTHDACQNYWYSKGLFLDELDGSSKTVHRIHVTPHEHDFRANNTSSAALRSRQATHEDDETVVGADDGRLYGAYVWMEGNKDAIRDDFSGDQDDFTNGILTRMGENPKHFEKTGAYCMDFMRSGQAAATYGYMYYYNDEDTYDPSHETSLLHTCREEAALHPHFRHLQFKKSYTDRTTMNQIFDNALKICGVFLTSAGLLAIFWFYNRIIGRPLGGFILRIMSIFPNGRERWEALESNPAALHNAKTGIGAFLGLVFCTFVVLFELEAVFRKGGSTSEGFRMPDFSALAVTIFRGILEVAGEPSRKKMLPNEEDAQNTGHDQQGRLICMAGWYIRIM
ncbi:hypothetical protein Q7P37_010928 [Cladosporium fusiforme]